jgi:HEPN domain-containing protein
MCGQIERMHLVGQWVQKAENDLKNAEHTLTMGEDCPYDTVCFHAQQCVEKYLKALLTYLTIEFPKIHDIGELIDLLPAHLRPPLSVIERERVSDYAVEARYPGDWEPITRTEAEDMVAIARRVREVIRTYLPEEAVE